MNILITGGAGFVGSNVANQLKRKHDIKVFDNLKFGCRENLDEGINFYNVDFSMFLEDKLNQFDILLHLACANIIYAQHNKVDTFKVNALDSIDLFKKFKGKIIYTSTASVYGDNNVPTTEDAEKKVSNAYDQSKLIAEKYLELRGNYTTLRLSNVYGPNQRASNPYSGVIAKFITAGLKGNEMHIHGDGSATRDYTYIDDVVNAIDRAIELDATNCPINISGNEETSIEALAVYISHLLEIPINVKYIKNRQIDTISRRWLDITRARDLLGWEPKVKLKEGLIKTIEWNRTLV
jgi:UDP-glucose 4-epimerase